MPGTSNSGGHNAKNTSELEASGTFRPDRHGGFVSPDPPSGRPEPPKTLSGEALGEWNRMLDRMEKSGTLKIVDDAALYQYVTLFAEVEAVKTDHERLRKISDKLMKEVRRLQGQELLDAVREIVRLEFLLSKQSTQLRQGHMAVRQYLVEFGQTPSSRNRVKIVKPIERKSRLVAFRGGKQE